MNTTHEAEKEALSPASYPAVALISAAIIAYELFVMRVFANGGWSHFGSTVISIAMFGFGFFSVTLCLWKESFKKHINLWINIAVMLLGPLMLAANSAAQQINFNPIFLVSDPNQKYYLALNFLIYFIPFLFGAMFLGLVFLRGQYKFGQVYFANMSGSGLGGMVLFGGMYLLLPEKLFYVPLALWFLGALLWFQGQRKMKLLPVLAASMVLAVVIGVWFKQINVSQYKGVSYARNFPDSQELYHNASPFGNVEVFSSSYFHFAPGLSDAASLYLDKMPEKAYLGMYFDGDGPIGIMKALPPEESEYINFLPFSMPYLLKKEPNVLVMQFGGGISTNAALKMGAKKVTVAEGNPMVVQAVRDQKAIADFTGHILENKKIRLVEHEGRIYVRQVQNQYDIIDLSLADSTGLSMPGGFSVQENYTYTVETFAACINALKPGGILSVTIWNKEDPPKSTLKLFSTLIRAALQTGSKQVEQDLFISHTYLSTLTVLYKKGGFSAEETQTLLKYCRKMNFELIYHPGQTPPPGDLDKVFTGFNNAFFDPQKNEQLGGSVDLSAGSLYRLAIVRLLQGDFEKIQSGYVFSTKALTDDRPYFSGFVKLRDVPKFLDKLEAISDEWGYLLLWATLLLAAFFGFLIMLLPMIFGWRALFSRHRGKAGLVVYFICLGIGYIVIEIGLISKYVLALGYPTVSISVLITGMLVFSGIGSYFSGYLVYKAGKALAVICTLIAAILLFYVLGLDAVFDWIGLWPYSVKILVCLGLLFPLAFLLGFPFALGMSTLSRLNKEHFFVWAWGVNGAFSVVGSVLVPILAVNLGLSTVLLICAGLYLIALPAFFHLRLPDSV